MKTFFVRHETTLKYFFFGIVPVIISFSLYTLIIDLFTLTNYEKLIEVAQERDYIKETAMESLAKWRENPEKWSEERMNG